MIIQLECHCHIWSPPLLCVKRIPKNLISFLAKRVIYNFSIKEATTLPLLIQSLEVKNLFLRVKNVLLDASWCDKNGS